MARQQGSQVDFAWLQLLKVRLQNLGTAPTGAGAVEGGIYADTATHRPTYHDGTSYRGLAFSSEVSGAYTDENARDAIGAALVQGSGITVTVNDASDTITIASTITQYTDEMAQDAVAAALTQGAGITISYNDAANTITIASSITQYTAENAQDDVGGMLTDTGRIDFTYNDAAATITADIIAGSVANSYLANMAPGTVKANTTGGAAAPSDVAIATTFKTALGLTSADLSDFNTAVDARANAIVEGRKVKDSVDAATTAALPAVTYSAGAGTLTANANGALAAQDGVTLAVGDSLLVKDQASTFQNGIYDVTAVGSGGAPFVLTRRADASTNVELQDATVYVEGGTALTGNKGDIWTQTNAIADLTAAAQAWAKTGEGGIDPLIFVRQYAATIGDNSTNPITVTHSIGTRDVSVTVRDATTHQAIDVDWTATSTTQVTLTFGVTPTTNQYRVTVQGKPD